jgi:hypothetical protein
MRVIDDCVNKKCLINNIVSNIVSIYMWLIIRAMKMDAVTQKAMTKKSNL